MSGTRLGRMFRVAGIHDVAKLKLVKVSFSYSRRAWSECNLFTILHLLFENVRPWPQSWGLLRGPRSRPRSTRQRDGIFSVHQNWHWEGGVLKWSDGRFRKVGLQTLGPAAGYRQGICGRKWLLSSTSSNPIPTSRTNVTKRPYLRPYVPLALSRFGGA